LAYTSVPLLEPDKVSRGVAEGAVTEPIGLLGWLLDHLGTGPFTRSRVALRSLVARRIQPYVPFAIISRMVRRSSSVIPGSVAGGAGRMDVSG
jgi:hypothetical protein